MSKITTLFDLNQTAATAAQTALGKDALSIDSIKLEAFNASGHDRDDYRTWEGFFSAHIQDYSALKARKSPATLAAEAAEKTASSAAATAAS